MRLGLIATLLLSTALHAQKQYPLCSIAPGFVVGETPDQPFTAHLTSRTLKLSPDGHSIEVGKGDAAFDYVARDSRGRVLVRRPSITSSNRVAAEGWWSETICDPNTAPDGTETFITFRDPSGRIRPFRDEAIFETPADAEGEARVKPRSPRDHTTVTFQYFHNHVSGRVELPAETFQGTPAFRYQLTATREPGSMYELVHSDSLLTQLARVTWLAYPDTVMEVRFTEFTLGEPQASLFAVPHGIQSRELPMDHGR